MLNEKNQFLPNQNGGKPEWHRYSEEKPPMVKSQEPDAKSQTPRAKCQEPDAKSQMPRAKCQEPDAKDKWHRNSEKSKSQMRHPWNQYLISKLMIFDVIVNSL